MNAHETQQSESRYGWVMVALAPVFLGLGSGYLISISVFLKPISAEFGWLRGETSLAYMVATFSLGVGGVVMGHLADRFSTRPVVVFGALSLGASALLLSNQSSLWEFYLYNCMLGGLGNAALFSPLLVNVGNWFDRNKGLAIGITTAAHALGQGLVIYLARHLISTFGWREAYLVLGLGALVLLLPLTMLIRDRRPRELPAPAGAPGRGFGGSGAAAGIPTRKLTAWFSLAAIFCCICMASPIVHVVSLATDRGLNAAGAAYVLCVIMVMGVFGRIFFGKLADHLGGIPAYLLASAGQAATVFWFALSYAPLDFYSVAMLFGFAHSGVMTSLFFCVRELIPANRRGVSQGIIMMFASIGMGLGGAQGGFLFDLTGAYTLPFAVSAAAGLMNLGIVASLYFYLRGRRQAAHGPRLPVAVPPAVLPVRIPALRTA